MWYGLTHLFHSLVSQVHIRHMCGATPSPMVCFRMVIYIWLHNQLTTTVELISSNGLVFWKLRMCVMMMWQRSFSSHTRRKSSQMWRQLCVAWPPPVWRTWHSLEKEEWKAPVVGW